MGQFIASLHPPHHHPPPPLPVPYTIFTNVTIVKSYNDGLFCKHTNMQRISGVDTLK